MSGLATLGAAAYIIGWLITVVLAFRNDGPAWGVATFLVPVAWIYYMIKHWRKVWLASLLVVVGATLFIVGGGFSVAEERPPDAQRTPRSKSTSRDVQKKELEESVQEMLESYRSLCLATADAVALDKRLEQSYAENPNSENERVLKESKERVAKAKSYLQLNRLQVSLKIRKIGPLGYVQVMRDAQSKFDVIDQDCPP